MAQKIKKQVIIVVQGSTKIGRLRAIKDLMRGAIAQVGSNVYREGKKIRFNIDKLARAVEAGEVAWIIDTDKD